MHEQRSLLAVVQELNARGWTNKVWTTRKGIQRGGRLLIKTSLHQLLTNVTYTGKVRHKGDLFAGEHPGIVAEDLFDRVQGILHDGKNNASRSANGAATALLRGLARCAVCDRAMAHSYASRGAKRYRYYVCTAAQKQGWHTLPESLGAGRRIRAVRGRRAPRNRPRPGAFGGDVGRLAQDATSVEDEEEMARDTEMDASVGRAARHRCLCGGAA